MTYQGGVNAYTKTQVSTTTSQRDLIVMAYDGIIRFLRLGVEFMEKKDYEQKHINFCKAKAVIEELSSTLNKEKGGQIAVNLWNLYVFFLQKITEANVTSSREPIDAIMPSIQELRDAWAEMELPKEDAAIQRLDKRQVNRPSGHVSITG